jgi:putative flavoprotein involved in K+ transport
VQQITTVVVGAGHSGLAMSRQLSAQGIDHVVLERGKVANSWETQRWDSLRLLTPNWQSRLPDYAYTGPDPDGYMTVAEVVAYLRRYAETIAAPVMEDTTVRRIASDSGRYVVVTDRGNWTCRTVVMASGACNLPAVPALAAQLPDGIASLTPFQYHAPDMLAAGGVMIVGASATGIQLAREIRASGREVVLCVGEHVRVPRTYRGRDITWWMDAIGLMDVRYNEIDDVDRAQRLPSLQLIGTPQRETVDLNSLQQAGVEIVGKLVALESATAKFSGALHNHCTLADLKMNRLLDSIDDWIRQAGREDEFGAPSRLAPTRLHRTPRLFLDLGRSGIRTVIWATGFRPDHSWVDLPVFDRKGRIRHSGGVAAAPGLYLMGLPFMRRRKSSFIDGAGDDAADLAAHLSFGLRRAVA